MYVVLVEFTVKPEKFDTFLICVSQQAKDSLDNEEHCLQFDVCKAVNNEPRVMLYEIYTDASAFDKHLTSDHFKTFSENIGDCVINKKLECYELVSRGI